MHQLLSWFFLLVCLLAMVASYQTQVPEIATNFQFAFLWGPPITYLLLVLWFTRKPEKWEGGEEKIRV